MVNDDNLVLYEKWRPKTLESIILPDRIKEKFIDGVKNSYIFYGDYGMGKTSLARILIGTYTKDKAFLEINSSFYTSIDTLRNEVERFCKTSSMISSDDDMKYVFLDEFEKVSASYQEGMKAFIEHYNKRVRFILTTNHYNKISDGIKSRCTSINFNPKDSVEETDMRSRLNDYIRTICRVEDIVITDAELDNVINRNYPDIRSIIQNLQNIKMGGEDGDSVNINNKVKIDLYRVLFKKNMVYDEIYHFIMDNFGPDGVGVIFNLLGRPFVDFMISKQISVDKLFECNNIITDEHYKLDTNTDPIILAMTTIGKLRKILIQ